MLNRLLSRTEDIVNHHKSVMSVIPEKNAVVHKALDSLIRSGEKLINLYQTLLEDDSLNITDDYNYVCNEIKRTETNFASIQYTVSKLLCQPKCWLEIEKYVLKDLKANGFNVSGELKESKIAYRGDDLGKCVLYEVVTDGYVVIGGSDFVSPTEVVNEIQKRIDLMSQ